jgi:hypothetical protein
MRDLFDQRDTIQERFDRFDAAHADVYALFKQFATQLLAAGRERYSADAILQRVRWHYATSGVEEATGLKLNDQYSSRYARKLMREDGRFVGFFELRRLRSA